jgi:hypothetical protein
LRDEIIVIGLSLVELESKDNSKDNSFGLIEKYGEAIKRFNIPLSKRISLRIKDVEKSKPEEFTFSTRLCSASNRRKTLIGEDAHLCNQLF